jgi:uncharacterized protein
LSSVSGCEADFVLISLPRPFFGGACILRDKFPIGVAEHLNYYVYRLIDPRNGETFYVGKGRGDRIFQHAKNALTPDDDEDAADLKLQRIKEIRSTGLDVVHVVHRHNMDESTAFQIEAAIIDAFPGLTNRVGGHGSDDYGVQHVEEIIAQYAAEPFVPAERLLLISIARSYDKADVNIYDAVRGVWRIDPKRAECYKLVLAHRHGLVLEAFRPECWIPATKANFPSRAEYTSPRWGFVGKPADEHTRSQYVGKRVPDRYRRRGAANPFRFVDPEPLLNKS